MCNNIPMFSDTVTNAPDLTRIIKKDHTTIEKFLLWAKLTLSVI